MGNTTQQMTAQPQDPNEVVDILVELDDEPAAAVLAAQSLTPGTAAAEKTAIKGVSRAFVAGSYTLPTVEQADTQALQVALATNQFTGKGMTSPCWIPGWIPPIPPLPTPRQTPNSLRTTSAASCRRPTSTPRP